MSDSFSADSKSIGNAVVAPGAGATVATLTGLQAGARYKVLIRTGMAGTIDTTNVQNLVLKSGGATIVATLPSVALEFPLEIEQLTLGAAATDLTVSAIGAFAAASIVACAIVATRIG